MAGCKVYVSTLGVFDELAEKASKLEICVFLELSSIYEVEESVGSVEVGYEWCQRALLRTSKPDFRYRFGKTSEVGVDPDHNIAVLETRPVPHTSLNGIIKKLSSPRAAFGLALK